ncbi:MAG: hypothetical protein KAR47_12120 [Planctomycetes bacterium]|nr:hypothetical protein [Planctomycetota bacterium]
MKKAVLEKADWRKIGKTKVVSVASPSHVVPASPQAIKVTKPQRPSVPPAAAKVRGGPNVVEPQQGVGVPPPEAIARGDGAEPGGVRKYEEVNIAEYDSNYEVKEMETSTVAKPETRQGHYTNNTIGGGKVEKANGPRRSQASAAKSHDASRRRDRDLRTGMDVLDLEFLLTVVENTGGNDTNEIAMRKLSFNELMRTQRVHELDSSALKVYAMDEYGHFGKDIQCEAMKELTERTLHRDR